MNTPWTDDAADLANIEYLQSFTRDCVALLNAVDGAEAVDPFFLVGLDQQHPERS